MGSCLRETRGLTPEPAPRKNAPRGTCIPPALVNPLYNLVGYIQVREDESLWEEPEFPYELAHQTLAEVRAESQVPDGLGALVDEIRADEPLVDLPAEVAPLVVADGMAEVVISDAGQTPLQSNGTDQFGSGLSGAVELNRSEATGVTA